MKPLDPALSSVYVNADRIKKGALGMMLESDAQKQEHIREFCAELITQMSLSLDTWYKRQQLPAEMPHVV